MSERVMVVRIYELYSLVYFQNNDEHFYIYNSNY